MTLDLSTVRRTAVLSEDGQYRYSLSRSWDDTGPLALWNMLNPSWADDLKDDPTLLRIMAFSHLWGYGRLRVVNLFALRSSDPRALIGHADPIGPDWGHWMSQAISDASLIMFAWGNNVPKGHELHVHRVIRKYGPAAYCLGRTASGAPIHPLARGKHRVPDGSDPVKFIQAA